MSKAVTRKDLRAVDEIRELLARAGMSVDRTWATVGMPMADSAVADIGSPGLWKTLGAGRCPMRVFECPLCVVDELGQNEEGNSPRFEGYKRLVHWATTTAQGTVPADWTAPAAEQVAAWVTPDALTVQAGEFA